MLSHRALALVVAFALIGPSTAAAQSGASDNQYADPFASTPSSGGHSAPGARASTPRRGSSAPAPAASAAPVTAGAPTGSAASSTGSASSSGAAGAASGSSVAGNGASPRTLPFTGFSALEEAIGGAVLLLAGAGLRLRLRRSQASGATPRPSAR